MKVLSPFSSEFRPFLVTPTRMFFDAPLHHLPDPGRRRFSRGFTSTKLTALFSLLFGHLPPLLAPGTDARISSDKTSLQAWFSFEVLLIGRRNSSFLLFASFKV